MTAVSRGCAAIAIDRCAANAIDHRDGRVQPSRAAVLRSPDRGGDFGVDLLIPAEGGHATLSHPRTALEPQAFRDCVVAVFERIDFARPRNGRTTVSYSMRFTP